jgi:acetylornithine deacetylase
MAPDPVALARTLIDIDSTTGLETGATDWLAGWLQARGYVVEEQPVSNTRANLFARLDEAPAVVFAAHLDCVAPFLPSREADRLIFGRGACAAKGALAAQVTAIERLRVAGAHGVGLLVTVGGERDHDGARVANGRAPGGSRHLVYGAPTDNRLATAARGDYRVRLRARERAPVVPPSGGSAIDTLLDALMVVRGLNWPEDPVLGRTHYSVGLIEGGTAAVDGATAELHFRTVGDAADVRALLRLVEDFVEVDPLVDEPALRAHAVPGFETTTFPRVTDVACLDRWGAPLLVGPGSAYLARRDEEHVSIDDLLRAVDVYVALAGQLGATPP